MEINNIFIKNNCLNNDLNYQTTSDYVSSDEKISNKNIKPCNLKIEETIKQVDKKIIINKRNFFLIKY
jgi:hypothetical protein